MTVRQHLGELLNEVQYRRSKVVITKAGKPVAALVDIATLERLRKFDAEFARLRAEITGAFAETTDTEVDDLLDEALEAVRNNPQGD